MKKKYWVLSILVVIGLFLFSKKSKIIEFTKAYNSPEQDNSISGSSSINKITDLYTVNEYLNLDPYEKWRVSIRSHPASYGRVVANSLKNNTTIEEEINAMAHEMVLKST